MMPSHGRSARITENTIANSKESKPSSGKWSEESSEPGPSCRNGAGFPFGDTECQMGSLGLGLPRIACGRTRYGVTGPVEDRTDRRWLQVFATPREAARKRRRLLMDSDAVVDTWVPHFSPLAPPQPEEGGARGEKCWVGDSVGFAHGRCLLLVRKARTSDRTLSARS